MTLAELEANLRGTSLDDILLPGFIDQEAAPVRLRAMLQTVYLECGSSLVELAAIGTTGTMRVSLSERIRHTFELEEGMIAAVTSIRQQILNDADGSNEVGAIRLWGVNDRNGDLHCAAMLIELANEQQIFVDPTYHFGIRLGGSEQRTSWLENWPGAATAFEHVLVLR